MTQSSRRAWECMRKALFPIRRTLGRRFAGHSMSSNEESRRWWTFTRSRARGWMMKAEKIRSTIAIAAALAVMPFAAQCRESRAGRSQEPAGKVSTGNAKKGNLVFENLGCNKCHGSEGEGVAGSGQSGGVPRIASTSLALPAFIQLVRKPKGVMPPFGSDRASDSDLADVHAYLQTLKTPPKQESAFAVNPSNSQPLFVNDRCSECHPSLHHAST